MSSLPRSETSRPFEGYPAYGAVHDVLPNQQLREFLFNFSRFSDRVFDTTRPTESVALKLPSDEEAEVEFDPIFVPETAGFGMPEIDSLVMPHYDSRGFYKVFDPESLGVSVVEMDPAAKAARRFKTIWEGHDFGAVEKEAQNQIGQLPDTAPWLMFTRVDGVGRRLPGVPNSSVRQKLALMPDTDQFLETLNFIEDEADVIIDAIRRRLKQFIYNWDTLPHLTFSVFHRGARPDQISQVKERTNQYLAAHPFAVRLGDLAFRHKATRNTR